MGGRNDDKKPINPYCLLQMKMNEIEKTKKSKESPSSSSSKSYPSSRTGKPGSSSKSTADEKLKKTSTADTNKKNADPNIPDRSYGDYYCTVCESHMNSDFTWVTHINGKKHQKNIMKDGSEGKYEDLNVDSNVKYEIRNVKDTVVGLSYIQEIRRKEVGVPPLYTCFLCHSTSATVAMVIEHVISMKHRQNYIRENSPDDFQLLQATNLKKGQMEPLVAEVAYKLEQKYGRGIVKVKQERMKQPSYSSFSKRAFDSDDDDDDDDMMMAKKPKSQKYEEKASSVWKAVDFQNRTDVKEIKDCREIIEAKRRYAYSSDEDSGMHKQRDHIKRPIYNRNSRKYRSFSPFSQESKKEMVYPRTPTHTPPEESYASHSHYSRSPSQETEKKEQYSPRNAPRRPLDEDSSHYKSYIKQEKESANLKDYPLTAETKGQQADSSTHVLKDFVQKVYALPSEIFLKIVLLKLDSIEIKGIDELTLLSKVINKAQVVFCNKLPSDVEAIVRQRMFRNTEGNLQKTTASGSVINQVSESGTETNLKSQTSDFGFIKEILSRIKGNESAAAYQNAASHQSAHQNNMPYQSSSFVNASSSYQDGITTSSSDNYAYYSAPSTTTSGIPGLTLTGENKAQSSFNNTNQPRYFDHSSNYASYRY